MDMTSQMKTLIAVIIGVLALAAGTYWYMNMRSEPAAPNTETPTTETPVTTEPVNKEMEVIGKSSGGRDIVAYHVGEGEKEILFIGGIHGGYEWNTALVAFEALDYLKANPSLVPSGYRATVIPVLNPDGLQKIVGTTSRFTASQVPSSESATIPGRFNDKNVDLNRNFDCDWQAKGTWQTREVSGGSAAFSEPETQAIRDYVAAHKPAAAVVWYSAAGGVFASNCHGEVLPETTTLTNTYASASGYKAFSNFNFYEITGDMVNWFAKQGIPAISVLLTNHTSTEWDKNKKGIDAVLARYK